MKSKIALLRTAAMVSCMVATIPIGGLRGQQPENAPPKPNLLAPASPQSETAPSAPERRELTLEDRADIFMARKAYADAVDYYFRAMKQRGGSDAGLWNKLGIAYQQQMNYRAARKAYKRAIREKKDFPEPWNNMGTTYFMQDKPKKSLKYYRRAIELNAYNASFHVNLGTALYRRKKIPEALDEYRVALSLDPNVLTDRSSVGTVLQARGADPRFYFYLAKVFASLGRAEEAVRYLRRAFEDGFSDQKRLDEDPDFQKISEYPAYLELRNNPPVSIRE